GIESTSEDNPVFADERAKLAWAIAKAVDSLTATLPPEGQKLEARLITFDANDAREASRGRYAIFLAGTVIGTDQKGVFLVQIYSSAALGSGFFLIEKDAGARLGYHCYL
ncbi:MAG: hypothetical protein UX17_C0032G0001, partial [Parcubacteria group bacterium GW2011_GWC2_45_7]